MIRIYVVVNVGMALEKLRAAIIVEQRTLDPLVPRTIESLRQFYSYIQTIKPIELDAYLLQNYNQLNDVFTFIKEQAMPRLESFEDYLTAERRGSPKFIQRASYATRRKELASLTEKVFVQTLRLNVNRDGNLPLLCTRIFENIIVGITKFAGANEHAFPSYHNKSSCGPYKENNEFRKKNKICSRGLAATEIKRRKMIAERCLIERLIYDGIFRQCCYWTSSQDPGHMKAIKQARDDYMGCFAGQDIVVEVEDIQMNLPQTIIIKKYKNNKLVSRERYHRPLISNNNQISHDFVVVCEKEDIQKRRKWFKVQPISLAEEPWISDRSSSRPDPSSAITLRQTRTL